MQLNPNSPIGIFDSGVGGLTVASAIKKVLPHEKLVYFGDTAHLPYGDKSKESIVHFSKKISDFLLENECKAIIIACNTASANAFKEVQNHVKDKALVINVIDPVVEEVTSDNNFKKIGVIGTKGTIQSNSYHNKILKIKKDLEVISMATPLFVPMIEEGFIYDDISNAIVRSYLSKNELKNIDALILGCTHYPIIKNQINKFFNFNVEVVDSASILAQYTKALLQKKDLLNSSTNTPKNKFFVSDYTDYFEVIAKLFFEKKISLEKINFWK